MPVRKLWLSMALVIAPSFWSLRHPYYLSICEVEHNAETKALEITFKIFTDDLENALAAGGAEKLRLGTPQEAKEADRCIFSYLQQRVAFVANGDTAKLEFVGKEVELDLTWCYMEARHLAVVDEIEVCNRLLLEQHEQQANIVHVTVRKQRKSLLLHRNQTCGKLQFP